MALDVSLFLRTLDQFLPETPPVTPAAATELSTELSSGEEAE